MRQQLLVAVTAGALRQDFLRLQKNVERHDAFKRPLFANPHAGWVLDVQLFELE